MKDKKPSSLGIESFSDDNMSIQVTQPEGLFCQVPMSYFSKFELVHLRSVNVYTFCLKKKKHV